jgi:hypothetical protein
MMREELSLWTVYDNPSDYPGKFVARLFTITKAGPKPTENIIICDTLEMIRTIMLTQMHLTLLTRFPDDDPKIVEVWL